MENKDNIDKLFKEGLLEPEIPFNELDWEKMAGKLDLQAKRRKPTWLLWGSAAAAVILLGLFLVFLMPEQARKEQGKAVKVNKQQPAAAKSAEQKAEEPAGQYGGNQSGATRHSVFPKTRDIKPNIDLTPAGSPLASDLRLIPTPLDIQPNSRATLVIPFDDHIQVMPAATKLQTDEYAKVVEDVKKKMKSTNNQKQGLTLSAMLAPDISYAKSSIGSKVSSNVGLLATYGISPKLSLTSGAIYANKYYNSSITGVNAYNQSGAPYDINAVCQVIDIPLNVNYKLLNKKGYALGVNAGLSSYLMLKEKYDYIYPQEGSSPTVLSVEYRNQNQHFLGIANLGVSVERKISPHLSIGVQPFMKLPLTGIGAGDASLKSSGVSFSLNMSLFPAKKPGRFAGLRQLGSAH